jgi:hypothetical protein
MPRPVPRPTGPTCSVPHAAAYFFDLGRTAAYRAARSGALPTIRIGGKLLAVVRECERLVGLDHEPREYPTEGEQRIPA